MEKLTRIFDRLPSDAGVTFEGFEEIRIKSRESVKERLEDFIEYCKDAKKPAIRVILGEWGEGKTDAYKRYIQPKADKDKNYALFVSASTISNGYEVPNIKRLLQTTPLSALRFLVVLFICAREESKEIKIPEPERYGDAYAYLSDVLENLIGEKKSRRIFIFLDEFEELLLNPPRLKDIISGIKETVNGKFAAIDEKGEYEGCVHLIIAATPDAFYRLQVDEETSLIFGGLGRRAGVIELPQMRKQEGMEFLYALLKYSYKDNLPQPLPFDHLGIFSALFRIAQGNPGNLVSLFTRLMTSAMMNHNQIKKIDGEHLMKFLEKEQVFVYGGTTPCLDTEGFFRILKIVEEQRIKEVGQKYSTLLKLLCGELKPFSIEELDKRISGINVRNAINIINNELRSREGIERAILKVSPLGEGKSYGDVTEAFKEYITIEKDKKHIKIDNYSEPLDDFEDRITHFLLNGGEIIPQIYLPSERHSLMSFLEGITLERAIEIENLINRRLCKDEDYYLVSEELLSQIFPTPVPRELEFIKNRESRMKFWREVTRNLAEQYEKCMPKAFMNILEKSELFKLIKTEEYTSKSSIRFAELMIDEIKVNGVFYSVNGDVKTSDIEELNNLVRAKMPPLHCAILIYTGEITQEAEEKIINKELGKEGENVILGIHLHPTLAKRIICMYVASFKSEEVNENLFVHVIKKIAIQELDFQNKLKDWLDSQQRNGIFISDLTIEATSNLREFADSIKFYINFMDEEHTAEDIFNKNRDELLRFIKYESKKISVIPDIELPKFLRLSEDLYNNGFLQRLKDKYLLQFHAVEKRILSILKRKTRLSESELEGYFIMKNTRYLKDVLLPILEYKGFIRREANSYLLNDRSQLLMEVKQEYEWFKKLTSTKKYIDYGYVFMTKERGHRFIALKDFEIFVENLYRKAQETSEINEDVALQKLSLLKRFLQHFREDLIPLINGAVDQAENIIRDTRYVKYGFENKIDQVKEACNNWLKLNFKVTNITEYKEMEQISKRIDEYSKYEYNEITNVVNNEFVKNDVICKKFLFRIDDKTAFYFNPKLYLMFSQKEEFDQIHNTAERFIDGLTATFRDLNQRQMQIDREISKKNIPETNRITRSILRILQNLITREFPELQSFAFETLTLSELKKIIDREIPPIKSNLDNILGRLTRIDDLNSRESSFLSAFSESKELSQHLLFIFDIKEYDKIAENFISLMENITNEYDKGPESIVHQDAQALLQEMNNLMRMLDALELKMKRGGSQIRDAWSKYSRDARDYIDNVELVHNLMGKRYNIYIKEIVTGIKEIREIIITEDVRRVKLRLSEIEQMKVQVRQKLYETIKPILDEKEFRLLELVTKKIRSEMEKWIPSHELYLVAEKELGISQREAEEILLRLIEKGLFRQGISLSF